MMRKRLFPEKNTALFPAAALLALLVCAALFLLLGQDNVFPSHDQLDGEVISYLSFARHPGAAYYPEPMGGVPATAFVMPAPLYGLFYMLLSPVYAFILCVITGMLVGFAGTFLLCVYLTENRIVSAFAALLFALLPHLHVYGLTQTGIPMLVYVLLRLREEKGLRFRLFAYGMITCYGLASSLVLGGFAMLGVLLLSLIIGLAVSAKQKAAHAGNPLRQRVLPVLWGFLLLLCCYIITNRSLLAEVFFASAADPSHKTELVLQGRPFADSFREVFFDGTLHVPTFQKWFLPLTILVFALGFVLRKSLTEDGRKQHRILGGLFMANLLLACCYAAVHTKAVAALRMRAGGLLLSFQFDRVLWLAVPLQAVLFALTLQLACSLFVVLRDGILQKKAIVLPVLTLLCAALYAVSILRASDVNKALHRLLQGEGYAQGITWEDYFAPDLFAEMEALIREEDGLAQNEYRTLSFGLSPSAALYNGFYTLDGYSNNYPLSHKHAFREIIAGELAKSEALRRYYDDWGNRVYLFSADTALRWMMTKTESLQPQDIRWDCARAYDMGARYLFSAVRLADADAERMRLTLMRKEPFESARSAFSIWLYRVEKS